MTSKRDQRIALAVVGIILGGQVHPNSASGSEPPKALKERTPGGAATLFPDQDRKNQPVGAAAQEKVARRPTHPLTQIVWLTPMTRSGVGSWCSRPGGVTRCGRSSLWGGRRTRTTSTTSRARCSSCSTGR